MRDGLNRAIEIIDALQARYQEKYQAAIKRKDMAEMSHWQACFSALSVAVIKIQKELKK